MHLPYLQSTPFCAASLALSILFLAGCGGSSGEENHVCADLCQRQYACFGQSPDFAETFVDVPTCTENCKAGTNFEHWSCYNDCVETSGEVCKDLGACEVACWED